MLSKTQETLSVINGKACIVARELPNWYGIEDIGMIWHGEWADPEIEYNGETVNAVYIEDTLWAWYSEECKGNGIEATSEGFQTYVSNNTGEVYYLINACLGYE